MFPKSAPHKNKSVGADFGNIMMEITPPTLFNDLDPLIDAIFVLFYDTH